jgi:hypothetical protein
VLSPSERSEWISLAKKYKLLPPYINENAFEDVFDDPNAIPYGEFIIDLEGLSPTLLYVYLSTLRNIREDPGLPKVILYLVGKLGMNFFAAYVLASKIAIDYLGHHIIDISRPYGSNIDLNSQENSICIPLNRSIGIQRLVNNDAIEYDSRKVMSTTGRFNCSSTIGSISSIDYTATFQELFDEDIVAAIMSKDDYEAREFINRFEDKKSRIKYKEVQG